MSLSGKLITAVTVIVLVIVLIGIFATYTTFVLVFSRLELWGEVAAKICFGAIIFLLCCGIFLAVFFCVTEIQIRRLRLVRFAPTPEGYYEALQTEDGFIKPEDNVILQVPHTYSPKLTIPQRKADPPDCDDETILELYNQGVTLRNIVETTGQSYYRVQKITSATKKAEFIEPD